MKKILIFKTDKIGDLINISPLLRNLNLNFPDCIIDLVCSENNLEISKYYKYFTKTFIYKKPFFYFLFKNFNNFFLNKYDLVLQLDGKNHSYLSTFFIRASKKTCIRFIKKKKILNYNFTNIRPNIFLSFFFDYTVDCIEDYGVANNLSYHYSTLQHKILKKLDIKIYSRKHYLPFNPRINTYFNDYILIHIDERWSKLDADFFLKFKNKVISISATQNILITSNFNQNIFFNNLSNDLNDFKNIKFVTQSSIDDLINIIYYSHTVISIHTGLIVHTAASFNKKIVDIVLPENFNELDRWIPLEVNYKRFNIYNFPHHNF